MMTEKETWLLPCPGQRDRLFPDYDQTCFELPQAPPDAPADPGQGELFGDDGSQPDAADREPVFWTDGAGQSTPDDDFVQADAAESV